MKSTSFDANFNVFRFYLLAFGVDDVNFNHFFSIPITHFGHTIQDTNYFTNCIQEVNIFHSKMSF